MATNLSALRAVSPKSEDRYRKLEQKAFKAAGILSRLHRSIWICQAMFNGRLSSPVQRSETARLRSNIFKGFKIDDVFPRA